MAAENSDNYKKRARRVSFAEDEIMEKQRSFLRSIGSPSSGGSTRTMGSASSNNASKRVRSEHNDDKEQPASKKSCKAKGKKKVEINTNERSDFEECNEIRTKRPKLMVKIGVKTLVDAIDNMKPKQLAALEEMGFGQLVHLKITSIPAEMAFSLLENFNFNQDSSIKLLDDEPLLITEDDVHATLGLPRGELRINKKRKRINKKRKHKTDCVIETIAEAKGKVKITSTDVKEQLDADLDGGEWFKKVFLILLDSVLISPSSNGSCCGHILDYIVDISKVRQYNWCHYVLDVLIKAHASWQALDKSTPFTGPITFVLVSFLF